jgi:DNA-directed RNA polymerase specialized sigma24 family protein
MRTVTQPDRALELRLAEVRFRQLYAEHGREVMAYALRRAVDAEDAADVD